MLSFGFFTASVVCAIAVTNLWWALSLLLCAWICEVVHGFILAKQLDEQ
jgi:hypothetical protein